MSAPVSRAPFGRIDVSLTAISSRMEGLAQVLSSLLAQDYPDFRVLLHLSREPHLLDRGVPEPPDAVRRLAEESEGRLDLRYVPNWGPYRKLLPCLFEHWGRSQLVATADDDTIYPEGWLSGLAAAYGVYGCTIAQRGHRMSFDAAGRPTDYRGWMRARATQTPGRLLLPTGKDGVLYNTAHFPVGVLDIDTALRLTPTMDDLWFRWHLASNGVPVHLISTDYTASTFEEAGYADSLYLTYNLSGGNDAAVAALEAHFARSTGWRMADLAREERP
ncbi:hypothetical protein [Wenxinia marina]|uniref:Putative glycosyltransferase n=1 Tax=Wenxinia marina DSM 24838 TaxID=1123501 RepID=A0A0D0NT90_9RHOB|nr:hypothetical protein [Wenxinia marina]KIQ71415.1 putative glycosyltransferase [Wenxinia marina DSM 24838]GGL78828.1 hypothetical protein GCM10011392_36620 [Wenxinia marina]